MNIILSVSRKEDHNYMNLPGGNVELKKTFEDSGIREVKEETDLTSQNLKYLYHDIDQNYTVYTFYTTIFEGIISTNENYLIKWKKYNSALYNKLIKLI